MFRQQAWFRHSAAPRYAQLAELFRQRIGRGSWPVGSQLPTLPELMREFSVARVTVRQAIDLLARDGLVAAQRGRGTFVTALPAQDRWLRLETSLKELADVYRNDKPDLTLIEEASAMPTLRPTDGPPAPKYQYIKRLHARDGQRYCVIDIYLDQRVFKMAPRRFRRETIVPVLLDLPQAPVLRARQSLTVGAADEDVARLLDIAVNAPVAQVRRVFTGMDGTVMYLGEVTYRSDYIHLEMDLRA